MVLNKTLLTTVVVGRVAKLANKHLVVNEKLSKRALPIFLNFTIQTLDKIPYNIPSPSPDHFALKIAVLLLSDREAYSIDMVSVLFIQ